MTLQNDNPENIDKLRSTVEHSLKEIINSSDLRIKETPVSVCGIPAVKIEANEPIQKGKLLVYLHGGGYVFGSSSSNIILSALMSEVTGITVLSLDYRKAPEHPFPAAIDDVINCYKRILKSGFAPSNIGLFGDSAGAGLALSSVLVMKSTNIPLPAALGLFSPWTDLSEKGDSRITTNSLDPLLDTSILTKLARMYANNQPLDSPLVSPVYGDYRFMPPIAVHSGTRDILMSDAIRLVRKIKRNGGSIELEIWEGMWHVWQLSPNLPETKESITLMADFFKRHLGKSADSDSGPGYKNR